MTAPPTNEDGELLRRMAAGDEEAFTEMYGRWQRRIHRFALRMTGSREAAEDLTHDVFLALRSDGHRYDPGRGPAAAWIYGVARNHVRRRLERERPRAALTEVGAKEAGLLEGLALKEEVEALRRALLALPPPYREVVVLCELEEMTYADAAAALGCAVGTVRSRLHRGRARLAEALAGAVRCRQALMEAEGVG